jgi:hypothetical protein
VRFGSLVLGGVVLGLVACSAIVGVEDVKPKGFTARDDKDAGSGDGPATPRRDGGGVIADDAGSGDAPSVPPECNGVPDCERLVFVTKAKFTGSLGGISGADQKCFEAAKSIPGYKGRAFRAWLSDSTANASARIPRGTKTYRRTDKSVFATSFTDLTDGTVNLPALDETGAALTGGTFDKTVWTATSPAGSVNGDSCNDWTSEAVGLSGVFGDSTATDTSWTEYPGEPIATSSCNAEKHLYCIEY